MKEVLRGNLYIWVKRTPNLVVFAAAFRSFLSHELDRSLVQNPRSVAGANFGERGSITRLNV
jgi:hypothetical protein